MASTTPQLPAAELRRQVHGVTDRLLELRDEARKDAKRCESMLALHARYSAKADAYDIALHALHAFTNGEFGHDWRND